MRLLEENLTSRGIRVTARSMVRGKWEKDRPFLKALADCDIVVINGEGTLHHGSPHGERLLKVVDHPARGKKTVALINALYQENPAHWGRYLEKMALVSTRDSWSAESVGSQAQCEVTWVPDLSLSAGDVEATSPLERNALLVGDSVSRDMTIELRRIAALRSDSYLFPIRKGLKASKPHFPPPLRALREGYIQLHAKAFELKNRNILFNKNEAGFIDTLLRAHLHVTGRFHSVCFSLFTKTPFLALESNSWKIGALMHDFGLDTKRIVTLDELNHRIREIGSERYSDDEIGKIDAGLNNSRLKTQQMFDRIELLARAEPA